MGKKAQIKLFAGIIISVVIIYYSAKAMGGLNPGVLLSAHINWWLALISVAIFAFANFVRALAYPLGIEKKLGVMASFRIIGIGHAMNMVLPLRAGEGLRLMFFPPSYSAIERTRLLIVPATADFISIIMLSFLAVPFAGFKDPRLLHALNWISVASLGVFVLLLIIILSNPKLRAYCSRYMKISVLNMFVWVMLSWVVMLVSLWLGLISFGFSGVKSVRMSLAVFAATNIISFVPSTPGGIGLFEYGAVLGLGGLGISMQTAKTAGILLHLIQYAGLLPLGAVLYLTRFGKNSQ
jgi:uncharacterized membrane protein YbhN (UPF0104 family)